MGSGVGENVSPKIEQDTPNATEESPVLVDVAEKGSLGLWY